MTIIGSKGLMVREPLKGVPAAFDRHVQIEQHNVDGLLAKLFDSLVTVGCADHVEAFRLYHGAERIEHRAIIVDEENPGFVHCGRVAGACGSWRSRRASVLWSLASTSPSCPGEIAMLITTRCFWVASVVHIVAFSSEVQPACRSRQTAPRRSSSKARSASGVQPIMCERFFRWVT